MTKEILSAVWSGSKVLGFGGGSIVLSGRIGKHR